VAPVCPGCFTRAQPGSLFCPGCGTALGGHGAGVLRVSARRPSGGAPDDRDLVVLDPMFDDRSAVAVDRVGGAGGTVGDSTGSGARRQRAGAWAIGLAVIAAAIGLAVGSADDGSGDAAAGTTTTASDAEDGLLPTPSSRRTTTTERPGRRSTTTTSQEPHGPYLLAPTGTRLLVADQGDLVEIDLDTGIERIVATELREIYPGSVGVTDGWAIVSSGRGTLAVPLLSAGEPTRLGDGSCGGFASARPGHGWIYQCSGPIQELHEISLATGETVDTFTLPIAFASVLGDSEDGLIVSAPGGVYLAQDADTFRRISDGVGSTMLGEGMVLLTSCDDRLVCQAQIVDVVTGGERSVDVPVTGGLGFGFGFGSGSGGSRVSGTRAVFVMYGELGPELRVIDVASGEVFEPPGQDRGAGFDGVTVLSPDGSWVFWSASGSVRGWHVGDPDIIDFDLDGRTLIAGY
jgi:hypothetical protein